MKVFIQKWYVQKLNSDELAGNGGMGVRTRGDKERGFEGCRSELKQSITKLKHSRRAAVNEKYLRNCIFI